MKERSITRVQIQGMNQQQQFRLNIPPMLVTLGADFEPPQSIKPPKMKENTLSVTLENDDLNAMILSGSISSDMAQKIEDMEQMYANGFPELPY